MSVRGMKLVGGLLTAALVAVVGAPQARAQAEEGSFSVMHTHDAFFGPWTGVTASMPVSEGLQLTAYGILWDSVGGTPWTEYGAGVSFDAGPFAVSTLLGITNGNVLSGGGTPGAPRVFNDGIVPNITLTNNGEMFEGQIYAGYYIGTRETTAAKSLDFLHHWVYQGYKITPWFSAGFHWEHLENTKNAADESNSIYAWIGPYVSMTVKKNFQFRFAGGADLENGGNGFYKTSIALNF